MTHTDTIITDEYWSISSAFRTIEKASGDEVIELTLRERVEGDDDNVPVEILGRHLHPAVVNPLSPLRHLLTPLFRFEVQLRWT